MAGIKGADNMLSGKILSRIIALTVLCVSLAACGDDKEAATSEAKTESTTTVTTAETVDISSIREVMEEKTATTTTEATATEEATTTEATTTATTSEMTTTTVTTEVTTASTTTTPEIKIQAQDNYTFRRNNDATISIKGKPNTEYKITVNYKSGPSNAEGLEKKTSDGDGNVSWTWHIGGRTTEGNYDVVFEGGGEKITKEITILVE